MQDEFKLVTKTSTYLTECLQSKGDMMFKKQSKNNGTPKVHKKVRKHDMIFEYALIVILLGFFGYLMLCITRFIKIDIIEIGTVSAAVIALYALIWQLYSAIKAKRVLVAIRLGTKAEGQYVKFSCELENIGTKSIYPYLTNLYITEGIEKVDNGITKYEFERFTEHQINRDTGECFDCLLAEHCKNQKADEVDRGNFTLPPIDDNDFNQTKRLVINLRELSYFSLIHIMPKEKFRQEIILRIEKPGVYRAFAIYTGKEWDDCICTTTLFRIQDNNAKG